MLKADGLCVSYGEVRAITDVSFELQEGEILAILGANGAGKTTLLRSIMGLKAPQKGKVFFRGRDITCLPPYRVVRLGLSLVPEGRGLFPHFTVYENLLMGAFNRRDKSSVQKDIDRVYQIFPRLKERHAQRAGSLSGGEQQMLAVARSLMAKPQLLLMDEPSMGIMPSLVTELFGILRRLPDEGVTVLLVEQNARKALAIATRALVLEMGRVALAGGAEELRRDPRVRTAYLGEGGAA